MHENKCNRVKSFFPLIKRINGNDKRICQFRIQLETSFELTLIKRGGEGMQLGRLLKIWSGEVTY